VNRRASAVLAPEATASVLARSEALQCAALHCCWVARHISRDLPAMNSASLQHCLEEEVSVINPGCYSFEENSIAARNPDDRSARNDGHG
jgi:hypothetical protein